MTSPPAPSDAPSRDGFNALAAYRAAFANPDRPLVFSYRIDPFKKLQCRTYTAGTIWELACRGATALRAHGLKAGDRQLHAFGNNHYLDLVYRLAALLVDTVPVTVNWQADTVERLCFKADLAEVGLVIHQRDFDETALAALRQHRPELPCLDAGSVADHEPLSESAWTPARDPDGARLVIFTSGTTGHPKGAVLTHANYRTNAATFDQFLEIPPGTGLAALVVNPMHHANASAMTDWCLRRDDGEIHLIERYTTDFWRVMARVGLRPGRIVAPMVSRHFDFLAELDATEKLPVSATHLRAGMARIDFLLGSAPVGPTTIKRMLDYAGKPPLVRFGSTETCLQVMGIPYRLDRAQVIALFERGWHFDNGRRVGYYIGRPHEGHTRVRVVKSLGDGNPDHWVDCKPGRPGYLVCSGGNVMAGYLAQPEATDAVLRSGWYSGFKDIGYYLIHPEDGERDFFWMSRESTMLIRGGANYAYDQINAELEAFIGDRFGLAESEFEVAVVGKRLHSEHEDDCIATLSLHGERARSRQREMAEALPGAMRGKVSKGALPSLVRFGPIPRNFKGAVQVPALMEAVEAWLEVSEGETRKG
ncbi:class I adenylate-forming enzyme family protein [Sulfidibacter corallicola]|uniref:Acyl--CoA ligase n=1 Tax=Sulfidibacter corallicola TaxID=2818388 RepID=A0A8A4TR69_SULCO|nr:class I adenylate-forming enzyme family protein [Sulfidibacter corallicola]QTD51684.1 acyl--CoA ligase [Sulfidibacter corallicola]